MANLNNKFAVYIILQTLKAQESELSTLSKMLYYKKHDFGLSAIKVILRSLVNEGIVTKSNSVYSLAPRGEKILCCLEDEIKSFFSGLFTDEWFNVCMDNATEITQERFDELFGYVSCVKFIPYSCDFFPNQDDEFFFLNTIPSRADYSYSFDGVRGLGKDRLEFADSLCLFFNSGSIAYIGMIERYDHDLKRIYLKKGSVLKLKQPIFEQDLKEIKPDFRFVRNFITFTDSEIIEKMQKLISKRVNIVNGGFKNDFYK